MQVGLFGKRQKRSGSVYHCIVNPTAGRGKGRNFIPVIESFICSHNMSIEIRVTECGGDAAKWAEAACAAGSQGIIGVGGDGTMQEIVSGMLKGCDKCNTPLGVISCGSGNDWGRTVGRQPAAGVSDCLNAIASGKLRKIDAIRANDMACINIANIGLDARIVRNAQPFKKIFGKNSYVLSTVISIFQHKNIPVAVRIDGVERLKEKFTLAAICNGQYYGGGMRITPVAAMDDGRITMCLISAMSRLKVFMLFPLVLLERHMGLKDVNYIECKQVTIIPEGPQTLCLDGNLYECSGSLDFEILPGAIQIYG